MNMPASPTPREIEADIQEPQVNDEQAHRAGLYSIVAALLRDHPTQELLDYLATLSDREPTAESELAVALQMLALAARHSDVVALREEYHTLFIGLGRGELVPYGSWYQTGFLMEKPLGLLRSDLASLGFQRTENTHEPEDHIAALSEVMAMLIRDGVDIERQRHFFNNHIGNWALAFFDDLGQTNAAVFYKSVARLGSALIAMELRYLSLLD